MARGSERRLLVVGVSTTDVCGVRDYARVMSDALIAEGALVERVWWERDLSWSVARTLAEARTWLDGITEATSTAKPHWIIWHYSPFAYGVRGFPLLQRGVARALRDGGAPVLAVLHELAHDLGRGGWRGPALGSTQRVALRTVLRASAAYIVMTDKRRDWLDGRPWLPHRPGAVLPVCSNLPSPASMPARTGARLRLGVFGFAVEGTRAELAVRALATIRAAGSDAELVLLGRGGDRAVERWRSLARQTNVDRFVRATGTLDAPDLAAELSRCDLALFLDERGPTARRGTLAAPLASGVPVLALDGPDRWQALDDDGAAQVVPAEGFANAAAQLASNPEAREELGERGRRFYDERMSPRALAAATAKLVDRADGEGATILRSRQRDRDRPIRVELIADKSSLMQRRAHELSRRLPPTIDARVTAPGPRTDTGRPSRADVVYVLNAGRIGFPAAVAARVRRQRLVVELGDPGGALYRAQGRGRAAVAAGTTIDWLIGRMADAVLVRGRRLASIVDIRVPWIELPDGVDVARFRPLPADDLRARLGIPEDALVVGLVGSLKVGRRQGTGYGWDVVEALSLLRDEPVWGLLVGDGSALAEHRRRAEALGVSGRLVTPGRVPFEEVPRYISALDVCVSTQSNDAVGRSRTTAKLPEYLACDRHVLATAVGGALDALPLSMLLPYAGAFDAEHPKRLAERLASLVSCRAELRAGAGTRAIALARYDYDKLAARLAALLEAVVAR